MMEEYVFISYKFEQKEKALMIKELLEQNGISCWMAPESIKAGSSYAAEITRAITNCNCVILMLSDEAQKSKYVLKEIDSAIKKDKTIMPLYLEEVALNESMDYYLTDVQAFPAYLSWDSCVEKLIREIRFLLKSLNIQRNPDNIYRDPIKTPATLPNRLEKGFVLFDRYEIVRFLQKITGDIQQYEAFDKHTEKTVLLMYIDRKDGECNAPIGISLSGTFFQHPYIASPFDEYSTNHYYIRVEPFYNVKSLSDIIHEKGVQDWNTVKKWVIPICYAMIYMNSLGYVFGQMTSQNIRLQEDGKPILFDVSMASKIGTKSPSMFFLDPEGYVANPTSDIFALGMNMIYALTGVNVNSVDLLLNPNFTDELLDGKCSDKVKKIIRRCILKNPKKRYQDFNMLLKELEKTDKTKRLIWWL